MPLEDSVRLTPYQTIYRGDFFASEESTSSSEPLVVLFPVALARVRLASFDLVVECHEDSDIENVWAQNKCVSLLFMVYYPRRVSQQKRGSKRRRNGAIISKPRRVMRRARVPKRRGVKRARVVSSQSARAFFDASRYHGSPDLGVPDQIGSYTPIRGVTRSSVTAPTALGTAYYVFVWTPSQVRCMHLSHQVEESDENYFHVHFPFLASHNQSALASMVRPLRESISVRNISATQNVNGYIRILHTNHPMSFSVEHVTIDTSARVRMSATDHGAFKAMIDQHPSTRTITNVELRTGVSFPIVPATMSIYKEYQEWVNFTSINHFRVTDTNGDFVMGPNGEGSTEQYAANLIAKYASLTSMSTLIVEIPTLDPASIMSYDIAYHYQDAVRAADPDSIVAQFARPGRPMNTTKWNRTAGSAHRIV